MDAREAALFALMRFRRDRAWASAALQSVLSKEQLSGPDAALSAALCLGVLRNAALLDYYIDCFLAGKTKKLEPQVRDILRISVFQIVFMDKIPASAAVNEAVRICKKTSPRAAGLVNALLRRISENRRNLPEPQMNDRAEYLSLKYSHPLWIVNELIAMLGLDAAGEVLEQNNIPAPLCLQVNTLKTSTTELLASLLAWGLPARLHHKLSDAIVMDFAGEPSRLLEFERGDFYIQDAASKLAVRAASPKSADRVLDICAAPGGKSFAAAIFMKNEGHIVACDINEARLRRVNEGAKRLGIDIIKTRVMDASNPDAELYNSFDLVIADAPCSGLGVIRRRPEIRYKSEEELSGLPSLQLNILKGAARCLKPGGTLLYSVCTWRETEGAFVVKAFLSENESFEPIDFESSEGGMRTLWPQKEGSDGFFICKLRKTAV